MELKFDKHGLKHLNYVSVTISPTSKPNQGGKTIIGLFLSLQAVSEKDTIITGPKDMFIWICTEGAVQMFNTDFYNIDSVTVSLKKGAIGSHFTPFGKNNQSKAINVLKDIQRSLSDLGKIQASGIIDVETYENVPEALKTSIVDIKKRSGSSIHSPSGISSDINSRKTVNTIYGGNFYRSYNTHHAKEITTSLLKRTTKYPITSAIKSMKEKINAIKNGSYEGPKLKPIPDDEEDREKKAINAVSKPNSLSEQQNLIGQMNEDYYSQLGGFY